MKQISAKGQLIWVGGGGGGKRISASGSVFRAGGKRAFGGVLTSPLRRVCAAHAGDYWRLLIPGVYEVKACAPPAYGCASRMVTVVHRPASEAQRVDFVLPASGPQLVANAIETDKMDDWTSKQVGGRLATRQRASARGPF